MPSSPGILGFNLELSATEGFFYGICIQNTSSFMDWFFEKFRIGKGLKSSFESKMAAAPGDSDQGDIYIKFGMKSFLKIYV